MDMISLNLSQITPSVSIVANADWLPGASLRPGKARHPDGRIRPETASGAIWWASAIGFCPLRLRIGAEIHVIRIQLHANIPV